MSTLSADRDPRGRPPDREPSELRAIAPAKVGTRELGEQLVVRLEKVGEARLGCMELVLVLTVVGGHVHRAIAGRVEIARSVLLRALSDGLVVEAEAREGCELRDDLGGAGRVQVLVPNDMELLRREDALCHEQAGRIQARPVPLPREGEHRPLGKGALERLAKAHDEFDLVLHPTLLGGGGDVVHRIGRAQVVRCEVRDGNFGLRLQFVVGLARGWHPRQGEKVVAAGVGRLLARFLHLTLRLFVIQAGLAGEELEGESRTKEMAIASGRFLEPEGLLLRMALAFTIADMRRHEELFVALGPDLRR
eukprot:scaffold92619_cov63-Phaeocystis_antarctica.AAC.2